MATGRKNALVIELYGALGRPAFDLETSTSSSSLTPRPVREQGFTPDPRHRARAPLRRCLVAAGPRARLGTHLHPPGPRLPRGDWQRFPAVAVVRGRAGRPAGPGRHRRERRARSSLDPARPRPHGPPQTDVPEGARLPRPSPCSPASGPTCPSRRSRAWPPAGATTASRSPSPATTSTPGAGTSPATSRPARHAGEVRPEGLGDLQPPQGPGRLRRPHRLPPPGHRRRHGCGATATPRACASAPPRK